MINPVGVTTKKNIIAIITGEIYLPRIIPNLNQILFKGPSNLEFSKPNIKKIKEAKIAQILISLPLSRGQKAISAKTILRFFIVILFSDSVNYILNSNFRKFCYNWIGKPVAFKSLLEA